MYQKGQVKCYSYRDNNVEITLWNLESRDATLSLLATILTDCESPSWLLANEKLVTVMEYMLWDATRIGLAQHLSGTAPCLLYDLERLLSLIRRALGRPRSIYSYI